MSDWTQTPIPLLREPKHPLPEPTLAARVPEPPQAPSGTLQRVPAKEPSLIAVRHVRVGDRLVPVELFQNEGGSVAARCLLDESDTPIIDAPSVQEALAAVEEAIEGLLLARR